MSIDAARRDYGVVVTGTLDAMDLALDAAATRELRATMRAARKPAVPGDPNNTA